MWYRRKATWRWHGGNDSLKSRPYRTCCQSFSVPSSSGCLQYYCAVLTRVDETDHNIRMKWNIHNTNRHWYTAVQKETFTLIIYRKYRHSSDKVENIYTTLWQMSDSDKMYCILSWINLSIFRGLLFGLTLYILRWVCWLRKLWRNCRFVIKRFKKSFSFAFCML